VVRVEALVESILDILIRVSRHSPAAAHLVADCPRLWSCLRLLFIEVFPTDPPQVFPLVRVAYHDVARLT